MKERQELEEEKQPQWRMLEQLVVCFNHHSSIPLNSPHHFCTGSLSTCASTAATKSLAPAGETSISQQIMRLLYDSLLCFSSWDYRETKAL